MVKQGAKTKAKAGENLSEVAYELLLKQITDRTLAGGAIIQERKMAEALGISRTPMRKALARLEGEGLLLRLTDRLLSVKLVTLQECLDALSVRQLIEPEAARLATNRIPKPLLEELRVQLLELTESAAPSRDMHWSFDDRLHTVIARYSGNIIMLETVTRLRRTTRLFEQMAVPEPTISPGTEEHLNIIRQMLRGNPDKAAEAMHKHLVYSRRNVLDTLDQAT